MTIYTNDIPNSGESLGSTRVRIHDNFAQIFTVFNENHVDFNTIPGEGKHKFLQMPEQASAPTVATNEGGVYTKVGTNPAETNLFFRGENNGFEYQLTTVDQALNARFATITAATSGAAGTWGWTFLPGNMILNYGISNAGANPRTINFAKPYSSAADVFVIMTSSGSPQTITATTFDITVASLIRWYAIGK